MTRLAGACAVTLLVATAACTQLPPSTAEAPVAFEAAAQPGTSPPPGERLKFAYLGTVLGHDRHPGMDGGLRIRSAEALARFLGPNPEQAITGMDFNQGEVIAVWDPHHGCLGWPGGSSADYVRNFWAVDTGETVVFKVEAVRKPGTRQVLCKPAIGAAIFYLGLRRDKPVAGTTVYPETASPSPSAS